MAEKVVARHRNQSAEVPKGIKLRSDDVQSPLSDIRRRIKRCGWISVARWIREANCIGTALYIAGEVEHEMYVDPATANKAYLSSLKLLDEPVEGCIIAWQGKWYKEPLGIVITEAMYTKHAGIVTSLSPFSLAHRKAIRGKFFKNQTVDVIRADEELVKYETVFYLPKVLMKTANDLGH